MTLLITAIRPEGVWQSADHRLTRVGDGAIVDDATPKQVSVNCGPREESPRILLGFTGISAMPDRTPIIRWIRETLRGYTMTLDDVVNLLEERLKRDFRPFSSQYPLLLSGGVVQPQRRWLVEIGNVDADWNPVGTFGVGVTPIDGVAAFARGSGSRFLGRTDRELVVKQLQRRPRQWEDHQRLLAAVNRRAANADNNGKGTVSPWCQVSEMRVGETHIHTRQFHKKGLEPAVPTRMDAIVHGYDASVFVDDMLKSLLKPKTCKEMTHKASREELDDLGRRALRGRD